MPELGRPPSCVGQGAKTDNIAAKPGMEQPCVRNMDACYWGNRQRKVGGRTVCYTDVETTESRR